MILIICSGTKFPCFNESFCQFILMLKLFSEINCIKDLALLREIILELLALYKGKLAKKKEKESKKGKEKKRKKENRREKKREHNAP